MADFQVGDVVEHAFTGIGDVMKVENGLVYVKWRAAKMFGEELKDFDARVADKVLRKVTSLA